MSKLFKVDIWQEEYYRYLIPADSEIEARNIAQNAIHEGEGLDQYEHKITQGDASIIDVEEVE